MTGNGPVYVCYLDESGVVEKGEGTTHFVLLGLALPTDRWKDMDRQLKQMKSVYGLSDAEIHAGWMARTYPEQEHLPGFASMSWDERRQAVTTKRSDKIRHERKNQKGLKANYRHTDAYIHLTHRERRQALSDFADAIGRNAEVRLISEVVEKSHFYGPAAIQRPLYEFAFREVVQRFEYFLKHRGSYVSQRLTGLLVQDSNSTVCHRLTQMMHAFHDAGTGRTDIDHIVETPLFVDSQLTSMIQMADLCSYATRRFIENGEQELFNRIYSRFDRAGASVVGIRHFTASGCRCRICLDHTPSPKRQRPLPLSTDG